VAIERGVYKVIRIAPVRFARSRSHSPLGRTYHFPDVDDRGYTNPYNGPVVGVCRDDVSVVSVVREMLEPNAPLFATSRDTSRVTVDTPAIPDGRRADLRFTAKRVDGSVKIDIRAQTRGGPVVAELTVLVSQLVNVNCAAHRTAIYTAPATRAAANTTTRSQASMRRLIAEVNRQWRPCGIAFNVDRWPDTNFTNQAAVAGIAPTDGELLCPIYDGVTPNNNFSTLMGLNSQARRINIYFVHSIGTASASGQPKYIGFGSSFHKGLVMSDWPNPLEDEAHTLSHELAHILSLAAAQHTHTADSHSDDAPQWNAEVRNRRHDLWSRRRLMYYMVGLQADDRTGAAVAAGAGVTARPAGRYVTALGQNYEFHGLDVGHGAGKVGHLLTIKNLTNDPTDDEYTDARRKQRTLFP
jgi:hypothetical protein